ncbi:hypothetical protein TM1040_1894 [Ruegeria sp. TM1040]|nr:hypothetical protein TM1040_1894 [Ruegeria sp. TM1040]
MRRAQNLWNALALVCRGAPLDPRHAAEAAFGRGAEKDRIADDTLRERGSGPCTMRPTGLEPWTQQCRGPSMGPEIGMRAEEKQPALESLRSQRLYERQFLKSKHRMHHGRPFQMGKHPAP